MSKIRLTRLFSFEAAHALLHYDGPCRNFHGHTYKLQVTILGTPIAEKDNPKDGMVMDFGDLKQLVQEHLLAQVDHALILSQDTAPDLVQSLQRHQQKLVLVPYQPTCENMLLDFKDRLQHLLPQAITLHSLKLWETQLSFAEWYAADN